MKGICTDYTSTLEYFSFILLFAPDFPVGRKTTVDEAFQELEEGIVSEVTKAKNPQAAELFVRCRQLIQEALQLYKADKISPAKRRVQDAEKLFKEAGRSSAGARMRAS